MRRIPGAPRRAAASVKTPRQARADGEAAARTLRGAGVNMDLAPVADVARPGAALERERRTYSSSASAVAARARAFADGLRAGGVRATAKHYPGFGAATVNTDNAPQRIGTSLRDAAQGRRGAVRAADRGRRRRGDALDRRLPGARRAPGGVLAAVDRRRAARRLGFRGVTITDDLGTPGGRLVRLARRSARCSPSTPGSTCRCSLPATRPARRPPRACSRPRATASSTRARCAPRRGGCLRYGRASRAEPAPAPRQPAQRERPRAAGRIDRVAMAAGRLDQRDVGARRPRRRGVVARALHRDRRVVDGVHERRPARAAGCARAGRPAPSGRAPRRAPPPSSWRATWPTRRRSLTADIASTRCAADARRRADGARRQRRARAGPQRQLAAGRVAEQRHAIEVERGGRPARRGGRSPPRRRRTSAASRRRRARAGGTRRSRRRTRAARDRRTSAA